MTGDNWYIIRCVSGQESRAERFLERLGYPHGWHPVERVRKPQRAIEMALAAWKRAGARGKKPETMKVRPVVYGYVFIPADAIDPAAIRYSGFNCWMEVVCVGDQPYCISSETMAQMRQIPDRMKEMIEQAEWEAKQARLARLPVVGEKAQVIDGPLSGYKGIVALIDQNTAEVDFGVGCVHVSLEKLERVG